MKKKQTLLDFCDKIKKDNECYEKIAKKIKEQNKEEILKNKEKCILKLNESTKNKDFCIELTSSIGNVLTLCSLAWATYIAIDNIIISKNHEVFETTPIIKEYGLIFIIVGIAIVFHIIILCFLYKENENIEFYKNIFDLFEINNKK